MGRLIDADALLPMMRYTTIDSEIGIFPIKIGFKEIVRVIDDAPTVEAEPKWIPVSERLPKQGQEVICQCRASIIKVLKLDANGDWYQDANHCYMSGFVIAWMPLPDRYKEKEE